MLKEDTMDKVSIALITDNNYVVPTLVTMTSILKNKNKKSSIDIYILGHDLTEENKKLLRMGGGTLVECSVSLSRFNGSHSHVSVVDLTKFDLPNIFADLDKILYLDSDMIIRGDLAGLFATELGDNYVAAVKDMAAMRDVYAHIDLHLNNYFNAGMMLLNLKQMRKDKISEQLVEYKMYHDRGWFMSQDALNVIFEGRIVWLPPRYNWMAPNQEQFSTSAVNSFYNLRKNLSLKNALIVHFTNKNKVWNYKNIWGHKLWVQYYKKSVLKNVPRHYLECSEPQKEYPCLKQKKVIVSLTSYEARFKGIVSVIESIMQQTLKPDEIVLYLGKDKCNSTKLPQKLQELEGDLFKIHWIEKDIGSFTKLIPALKEYPNEIIVTVDDDIIYQNTWLEELLRAHQKYPKNIICHRAFRMLFKRGHILPYLSWIRSVQTDDATYSNFLTGVGGVLYPPHSLYKDVFKKDIFSKLCPKEDDIWFWAMAVRKGTKIRVVSDPQVVLNYVPASQNVGLMKTNYLERESDLQLEAVLKHYPVVAQRLKNERLPFEKIYLFNLPIWKRYKKAKDISWK